MIKATELRIGNLVQSKDGRLTTVNELKDDLVDCEWSGAHYIEPFPVSLTPEILKKCGFKGMPVGKYQDDGNWHLKAPDCVVAYDDRWQSDNAGRVSYNGCTIWCPILYLHQLQNLYFALTGEELTVDL